MAKHLHVVLYHLSLVLLLTEAQEEIFDETKRDWPRIHCHSKCSTGKFQWQYGVILMLLLHTTVSLVRQNATSYSPMLLLPSSLDLRICFEWRRQISQIDSSIPLARSWRIFSHLVNIQTIDYVKEREEFQISHHEGHGSLAPQLQLRPGSSPTMAARLPHTSCLTHQGAPRPCFLFTMECPGLGHGTSTLCHLFRFPL